jgi:hypothetical protein
MPVILLALICGSVFAQTPAWKLLGLRKVKLRTERDAILVGADEGTFKSIKLTVKKSAINMKDLKVHFSNGDVFDVKIRKIIPAGGETRVIDLPGAKRNIKKVVFWYKSTKRKDKEATVRLWGLR